MAETPRDTITDAGVQTVKIHPISMATMVKGLALYGVLFAFLDLMVWLAIGGDAPTVAIALSIFIVAGFVVLAIRSLSVPNKCWVQVSPAGIAWRTPPKPRRFVTPTGSVPLDAVAGFEVFPQQFEMRKGRPLNGEAVRLILVDGRTITLPFWCSAMRRTAVFDLLLTQLRSVITDLTDVPTAKS
jgi:hypothetical protein